MANETTITLPIFKDRMEQNTNLYVLERVNSDGSAISTLHEHIKLTLNNESAVITEAGTLLNAENMNKIVNSIKILDERIQNFDFSSQITNNCNTDNIQAQLNELSAEFKLEEEYRVADIKSLWTYLNFNDLYSKLESEGWIFTKDEKFDIIYETLGGSMPEYYIERYEIGKGVGILEMPIPTKPFYVFLGWRLGDVVFNEILKTQAGILYLVAEWGKAGFSERSDGYIDGFERNLPGGILDTNANPTGEQGMGFNFYNPAPCAANMANNGGWTLVQASDGIRFNTLVAGNEGNNSNLGMSWTDLTLTDGNTRTGTATKHIALSPIIRAIIQAGYSARITVSASFISGGRRIIPSGLLNARKLEVESMLCLVAGKNYDGNWNSTTQSKQVKIEIPNGRDFPNAVTTSGTISSTIIMDKSNINEFISIIWRFWTKSSAGGQNSNGDAWTRITWMNINWEVI